MNNVKSKPAVLIAALAYLLALSIPRSSGAGEIAGTWDGVVFESGQGYVNGQLTYSNSRSYFGVMSLDYSVSTDELSMYIGPGPFPEQQLVGFLYPGSFGPNGASGTVVATIFPGFEYAGYPVGHFSASYQSILPDGSIDTSNGYADGSIYENFVGPLGTGEVITASFQTIPEPPSIVPAASALLIIGIFAWVRRSGLRRWPRMA